MKQSLAFVVMLLSASMIYSQDIITLRTGETINGRISEVGINEIRYYKSDNPDGPVYVTSKADVAEIVYANGKKMFLKRRLNLLHKQKNMAGGLAGIFTGLICIQ